MRTGRTITGQAITPPGLSTRAWTASWKPTCGETRPASASGLEGVEQPLGVMGGAGLALKGVESHGEQGRWRSGGNSGVRRH